MKRFRYLLPALLCLPLLGLINPNFTPVDLVAEAETVLELRVTVAELSMDAPAQVPVVRVLKGEWADETLPLIVFDPSVIDALHGETVTGAAFLSGEGGYIELGGTWVECFYEEAEGAWGMVPDGSQKNTVWAGSAAMLLRAVEYVQSSDDPLVRPTSGTAWRATPRLGAVTGAVSDVFQLPSGQLLVTGAGGDRILAADATSLELVAELATASRVAGLAELTGDAHWDLIGWTGEALTVLPGSADGFAAEPLSLACAEQVLGIQATPDGSGALISVAGAPQVLSVVDGALALAPLAAEWPGLEDIAPLRPLVAVDLDDDPEHEWVQPGSRGQVIADLVDGTWVAELIEEPRSGYKEATAAAIDLDHDGNLDLAIAGGTNLFMWHNAGGHMVEHFPSGETDYIPNAGQRDVLVDDFTGDGIQDLVVLYEGALPHCFFNRGFATFGFAFGLDLSKGSVSLREAAIGQQAGELVDLDGDGALDLLLVLTDGSVHGCLREPAAGELSLGVSLADGAAPVTLRVRNRERDLGAWRLSPGDPVRIGSRVPGPVQLSWRAADGSEHSQEVLLVDAPVTVVLGGAEAGAEDAGW